MAQRRSTAIRDRHRATVAATKPPCGICGEVIDYALRWPDPGCFVVDHVTPLAQGGPDALGNKQAAHKLCNERKASKDAGVVPIIRRSGSLA